MAQSARVESVLAVLGVKYDPKPVKGWLWALCPFHVDSVPSWRIRITQERYGQHYCFSCKSGGGLADLVSHMRGITMVGACAWLEDFADQIPVIKEDLAETIRVEVIESRVSFTPPSDIIFEALSKWVSPARKYVDKRGVTESQIKCFRLGYAVEGRLAGRVVIPTWKRRGSDLVMQSYMARDFTEHRKAKRYLYPSTEDHPNLDQMFGEHTWPENRAESVLVVTEGAFNALAIDRVTTDYVTALGGSSLRDAHVAKIATFRAVFVFTDSDEAGDRVADELMQVLCRHTFIKRVRLPTDPNDRSGKKVPDANDVPPDQLRAFLSPWLRVAVS